MGRRNLAQRNTGNPASAGENTEKYVFKTGEDITIDVKCEAEKNIKNPVFGAIIHSTNGTYIAGVNSGREKGLESVNGPFNVTYKFLKVPLLPGKYFMSIAVHDEEGRKVYDLHDQAYEFQIALSNEEKIPVYSGFLQLKCEWEYKRER